MTKAELLSLVAAGENSGVEFKRDTPDNRAFAKEITAFANFQGGRVLLGVNDDGSIAGISRADLEGWVMNACRDKIRPEIVPYFEIIPDVSPGKSVAVVTVTRGLDVHHVWHDQHRTYYVRVGSQSREASPEELARLFQRRGGVRWELQPVSGSSVRDLDLRRLREYFVEIRQQEAPELGEPAAWVPLLLNTEFLTEGDAALPATAAGILLFGRDPGRFFPHSAIEAVVYPGTEKDYNAVERASLHAPLVRYGPTSSVIEPGLWEECFYFLRRHTSREGLDAEARRVRTWRYPVEVVREGVVNALVHRDYLLSSTGIELSIYADRLEIVSPGRPPNGINPDRMRTGCRAARNQLIKDTMRDYGYMEHMGMGIPRKIIRGMREHNGTEPDLIADLDGERFTLRLWADRRS